MSPVAFLLATLAAQPAPAEQGNSGMSGAQLESAEITVRIVRPAILKGAVLVFPAGAEPARSQVVRRSGRVTYEFE